jgi:hypothetical protein
VAAVKRRWYVTCFATECGGSLPTKRERVWTLSRHPKKAGWNTDADYGGYGLTFAQATELARAANHMRDWPSLWGDKRS